MKEAINKAKIAKELKKKNPSFKSPQALALVNEIFDIIAEEMKKGNNLYIRGFATIKIVTRKSKVGRNIRKNTTVNIPEIKKFKIITCNEILKVLNNSN